MKPPSESQITEPTTWERQKDHPTQPHDESSMSISDEGKQGRLRTPSPTVGAKRAITELAAGDKDKVGLAIDSRAMYEESKQEIDQWYDEEYSQSLGIPKYNKIKHSKGRWFERVAAWMNHTGRAEPPQKTRKLNIAAADDEQDTQLLTYRPDKQRWPGDVVAVPEYPFEDLNDYEAMPNGRYACGHVNRNPPADCCIFGVDRHGKRQAIKKSVDRWRKNVEKLIDAKKLDDRHKTWPGWYTPALKMKYQPRLYRAQQQKKAEKCKREREERQQQKQRRRIQRGARNHLPDAGPPVEPFTRPRRVERGISCSSSELTPQPQSPVPDATLVALNPLKATSNNILADQVSFLADMARTNPSELRAHDVLYRNAQYREMSKEFPDMALLREWYLAYFLEQKGQRLSAEQQNVLKTEDPSRAGQMRASGARVPDGIGKLFGEYLEAAKAERAAERTRHALRQLPAAGALDGWALRALRARTQTPSQECPIPQPLSPGTARVGEVLVGGSETAQVVGRAGMSAAFEIWDHEVIDGELNRILGTSYATRPAAQVRALESLDTTNQRIEADFLSSLPRSFGTGSEAVDDELKKVLAYAYQIDAVSKTKIKW